MTSARSRRWTAPRRACRPCRPRRPGAATTRSAMAPPACSPGWMWPRARSSRPPTAATDAAVPAQLDAHLICDNYRTHKSPEIKRWLVRHPRFHLHLTPTYSSWLNLVERWFAELTTRKLRRSAHRSVAELEADLRAWIAAWNEDPKPFVWTKTADELLDNLARYLHLINNSEH